MTPAPENLCMMFSGGMDTTLAAARILEDNPAARLHLLTFCNGFCVRVQSSRVHADELKARYGADRIVHDIRYVTEIFERMRDPYWTLVREYRSTLAFDLCCRLSFETAAIIYALKHGISTVYDGTNIDQGRLFLEKPAYLRVSKAYFAAHGIEYSSPVYARAGGREGRLQALRERGFSVGPRMLERLNISSALAYQPFCLFGIHTFFFTSFLRKVPFLRRLIARHNLSVEDAIRLRLDRQKIGHQLIRERTQGVPGPAPADRYCTTRLCGRNGVEIAPLPGAGIDLAAVETAWLAQGPVTREGGALQRTVGRIEVQLFPDGRTLILGTRNRRKAQALFRDHVDAHGGAAESDCGRRPGCARLPA